MQQSHMFPDNEIKLITIQQQQQHCNNNNNSHSSNLLPQSQNMNIIDLAPLINLRPDGHLVKKVENKYALKSDKLRCCMKTL